MSNHSPDATILRGLGATLALPYLDAMAPAVKKNVRLVCVEMVHGAAGSAKLGAGAESLVPAKTGLDSIYRRRLCDRSSHSRLLTDPSVTRMSRARS